MGTRGAYGFRKGEQDKLTYNHFDSYPSGLGLTIMGFIRDNTDENMEAIFDKIQLVNESDVPTPEQAKGCEEWTNQDALNDRGGDWYCVLRAAQGQPEEFNKGLKFMIDNHRFIQDSLFCEHAYIINLDTKMLEYYIGYQNKQNDNRYSCEASSSGSYACALVKSYEFEYIRNSEDGVIIGKIEADVQYLKDRQSGKPIPPEFVNTVDVAIFITNLGKYNEGVSVFECGKWLVLPVSQDELEEAYKEIGIDGEQYEEVFITDVDSEFSDIWKINEYDNIDTINETVDILEYMTDDQRNTVKAVVAAGFETFEDATWKVKQGRYSLSAGINDAEDYARDMCNECYTVPEFLVDYIDYKTMGEDWLRDTGDLELTDFGLVRRN